MDILTPPKWLDRTAKSYFNRVAPELDRLGKLDPLSLDLIAAASRAKSIYRQTLDILKDEPRVIFTPSGMKKTHPAPAVEKRAFEMRFFEAIFILIWYNRLGSSIGRIRV
jgi:P27 family predicted phage terminase small subunit